MGAHPFGTCAPRVIGCPSTGILGGTEWQLDRFIHGQNGIVWYGITSDNTDKRGLLIRGLGVRVPRGAPGPTCMFSSFDLGFGSLSTPFRARFGNGTGAS